MLTIGIAGGSGSGKTTLVKELIKALPEYSFSVLPQDAYYKDNSYIPLNDRNKINFDHPASIDFELLNTHINNVKLGKTINRPVYSFITCTRQANTITVYSKQILILEGILIFTHEILRDSIDLKVYVIADTDKMLESNIKRDTWERGRNESEVVKRFNDYVLPMYNEYVKTTMLYANIIVKGLSDNKLAIAAISNALKLRLNH